MEPISVCIVYVALKFIDQIIIEAGYNSLKKVFFPSRRYKKRLIQIIYKTINEYEKENPIDPIGEKFPFYQSKIFFSELNTYILFNKTKPNYDAIKSILQKNPEIISPGTEELKEFYHLFNINIQNDKLLKSYFIEENYKSKIFTISEDLGKIENKIDSLSLDIKELLSGNIFQPNKEWFTDQCKSSIYDLGKRYTPELNMNLDISEIFDGLGRTESFERKIKKIIDQILVKGNKCLKGSPEVQDIIKELVLQNKNLYQLYSKTDFLGTNPLPSENFIGLLKVIIMNTQKIYKYYEAEEEKIAKEKGEYRYYNKYGSELRNIREFENEIYNFQDFINMTSFKLANNPFLLLTGAAGIGKSHLLGDVITNRIQSGYDSIFILGQNLTTVEDPWTQIFKGLRINLGIDNFLSRLNNYGKKSGKRIIIFIDAINEGKGNYFWNNYIHSFIYKIRDFKWLGLVLSIRTSYEKCILPEEEIASLKVIKHTHNGFVNIEYEAVKLFFSNYNIELPSIPLLHPEFQNPLFLKLFCEGINKAGLTRIPNGLHGITSIINFYINNVNSVLSKPNRLDFSENINLVKKAIDSLIGYKVKNKLSYVSYETAYKIVDDSVADFINFKGFIDELIKEGVLSKNLYWKENDEDEEGVYLAYERFEDHLTAQLLINQHPDLESEFKETGNLHCFIKDQHSLYINRGLIEALSIQVPEQYDIEFYMLVPQFKDRYPIIESFIESLLWRKVETINDKSKDYINKFVFSRNDTHDLFWETILTISGIPNHYFNALFLHNHLMGYTLADRDAHWTQILKYKYNDESSVKRLIDWAWNPNDKAHISDDSILLSAITLAWFHTSTNRELRDCSTKALISLLQDRLPVLLKILKMFKDVNDPYVYERLFAVAYGCVVRTKDNKEAITEITEYVFETIFNNSKEVYPHILLRDYARNIIEYAHYLGIKLDFEISQIRPPYNSIWPEDIPTKKELEKRYHTDDQYYQLWSSVMGSGDFARYIIGTNSGYSEWSGCRIGENPIDRELVFKDFKLKLNQEQLDLLLGLDPIISEDSDKSINFKEIPISIKIAVGRKSEEELREIKTHFKNSLNNDLVHEYENELEPYLDENNNIINTGKYFDLRIAQRLIFSTIINLGWNPKLHLSFDKEIGTGRGRLSIPHERIGKKYQWIAYYAYMARLSDNFLKKERWGEEKETAYRGPWDPYVRDIDPTILIHDTGHYNEEKPQTFWWNPNHCINWNCTTETWLNDESAIPNMKDIIQISDDTGVEWLVLEGYPKWTEPRIIGTEKWDNPHKDLWCQIRSYIVKDDEYLTFMNWAKEQDFMGRWMPESGDRYEMFSREYYWSPAQDDFKTEYYGGSDWVEIVDQENGTTIAEVSITAQNYLWEEEFDKSKKEALIFLKPSTVIFKGMGLEYCPQEGSFIDNTTELQCFATNVYNNSHSYLLVKRKAFTKFLDENNLKCVWTVLGEKQIIGGGSNITDFPGRLEISGAYYFEQDNLAGKLNTKRI